MTRLHKIGESRWIRTLGTSHSMRMKLRVDSLWSLKTSKEPSGLTSPCYHTVVNYHHPENELLMNQYFAYIENIHSQHCTQQKAWKRPVWGQNIASMCALYTIVYITGSHLFSFICCCISKHHMAPKVVQSTLIKAFLSVFCLTLLWLLQSCSHTFKCRRPFWTWPIPT